MNPSNPRINLIWLSETIPLPDWNLGATFACQPQPGALHACLSEAGSRVGAWLLWDAALDIPPCELLLELLEGPADVWHAGLKLGLAGQPEVINFVTPTWMLNRDPDPGIEATSWRLSLRACLVRGEVLHQMGAPDPHFQTLSGAGLTWGYRLIRKGVFLRHHPGLVAGDPGTPVNIPLVDQLRFLKGAFDRRWGAWASFRAVLSGAARPLQVWRGWRQIQQEALPTSEKVFQRTLSAPTSETLSGRVSVLIPTLRRYPYLRTLLGQLRDQTVPPDEILVVDQTPTHLRDASLLDDFADLPIRYLTLDQAGQSSSRNHGLQAAKGDYVLFIDDDDEVPPDLIEKHMGTLKALGVRISSGVAHEVGAGALPDDFRLMRVSSVFPTNNSLLHTSVLEKSGLFDLAYDHGQRADHDLGMRLYLAGELMVLNPDIQLLHHHAPVGGLREHKSRVNTYAAARRRIFKTNLPTVSDLYLAKRYFSTRQVREMGWISLLGTFSLKGSLWKRLAKVIIAAFLLPYHAWLLSKRAKAAEDLLEHYPIIPTIHNEKDA